MFKNSLSQIIEEAYMRRFLLQTLLGIFVFSALQVPTVTHAETLLFETQNPGT